MNRGLTVFAYATLISFVQHLTTLLKLDHSVSSQESAGSIPDGLIRILH